MLDPNGVRHPLAKFAHVINVFLDSAFAVTSQAAEEMTKNEPLASNQRGVIINTAYIAGFEGQPGQVAYSAAKGGIIGMTLTIARDLAERDIRVMAIARGPFFRGPVRPRARTAGSPASPFRSRFRRVISLSLLLDGPVRSLWSLCGPAVRAFHQKTDRTHTS